VLFNAVQPMPILNYVSQTAQNISVTYAAMPAKTALVYVNQSTGTRTPSSSKALDKGGAGSALIPIEASLTPAQYYLLAQGPQKQYLAQTIAFSISGARQTTATTTTATMTSAEGTSAKKKTVKKKTAKKTGSKKKTAKKTGAKKEAAKKKTAKKKIAKKKTAKKKTARKKTARKKTARR
jgi:hypothetical protein